MKILKGEGGGLWPPSHESAPELRKFFFFFFFFIQKQQVIDSDNANGASLSVIIYTLAFLVARSIFV